MPRPTANAAPSSWNIHRDAIAAARPAIPSALNDRAADIWEPLLAIADLVGGDWPHIARQAAQQLSAQDDELTPIGYFLADLRKRQLGIRPRYIRVDDITGRGYLLHDIEAAFRRYVPKPDPTETSNANTS